MGLPMDQIHNPTVPSGPTSHHTARDGLEDGASLADLITAKERVESELTALSQVLESVSFLHFDMPCAESVSQHHVDMNTSLTTFDGYPRDDLDIAQSMWAWLPIVPVI